MTTAKEPQAERMMTAAVLARPEHFELSQVPRPPCPAGGLLLRVCACAVCGSDVRLFRGQKQIKGSQEIAGQVLSGHVIGHEIAGVIEEADSPGAEYRPGELVVVAPGIACGTCDVCRRGQVVLCRNYQALGYRHPGGFAEHLAVPTALVADGSVNRVPDGVPAWKACLAEPLACALNAQEAMAIGPGDSVLVIGAGPMGCLHVLLARQRGARLVVVSEPDASRRERLTAMGAGLTVDPTAPGAGQALLEGVKGEGYTAVIFAASSIEAIRQIFGAFEGGGYRLLAPGARVNLFAGLDPGDTTVPLDVRAVHYQGISILGSANSTPRQNAEALGLIASGAIPVERLITARLPLSRIEEALGLAMSRSHLKVVVEPGGDER